MRIRKNLLMRGDEDTIDLDFLMGVSSLKR